MVSLLPATATVIGVVVLTQIPSVKEIIGVGLVVGGVAVHQDRARANLKRVNRPGEGAKPHPTITTR
jgi:inner membrane transporter RhtA